MQKLINKVVKWGQDRGLDKVGHEAQARKTLEETAELLEAYAKQDINAINDAIGDILVTMIVGASNDDDILESVTIGLSNECFSKSWTAIDETFNYAFRQFLDSSLKLFDLSSDGVVDDYIYDQSIICIDSVLDVVNRDFDQHLSLQDCLQLAYNEIKNRTGKLVNGQFIKDN